MPRCQCDGEEETETAHFFESLLRLRLGRTTEFLQRASVAIAKRVTPVSQPATAPDLVTSTVHNPRTLVATSEPDTHDPTAATSWGALVALLVRS